MKRPAACIYFIVVSFALGMVWGAPRADDGNERVQQQEASSVVKSLRAPSRPDTLWRAPDLRAFGEPLREDQASQIDPQKDYELAELIDLAERANPETKVAWARAK